MFCPKCGKEVQEGVAFCPACGAGTQQQVGGQTTVSQDDKVGALGILFFLIPLSGFIMYFVWQKEKPGKAKKACNLAWIGFAVSFVINMIVGLSNR